MVSEEAFKIARKYRELAMRLEYGSTEQLIVDSVTLSLIDGDVRKFREYKELARGRYKNQGSDTQVSVWALKLAWMDTLPGTKGLEGRTSLVENSDNLYFHNFKRIF